jgi:hypothetical protein
MVGNQNHRTEVALRKAQRRTLLLAAICWGVMAVCVCHLPAQAQTMWAGASVAQANGRQIDMPPNASPASRMSGLGMRIDTRWANNYGYRPIEVTVNSSKPATTDRRITIRLHARSWSRYRTTTTVEQDFELPQGKSSATTTIALPQYQLASEYHWWEVWVDGIKDKDLSMEEDDAQRTMWGSISPSGGTGISCLVVGTPGQHRTLMAHNSNQFEFLSLNASEFPHRWLDYTCLDLIALSMTELQLVAQINPQGLEALRRWLNSGGQMWVTDAGREFEHLADISKLLEVSSVLLASSSESEETEATEREADDFVKAGWRPLRIRRGNREGLPVTFLDLATGATRAVTDPRMINRMQRDPNFVVADRQQEPEVERRGRSRWPADSSEWFVEQEVGLGTVRSFRGSKAEVFASSMAIQDPAVAAAASAALNVFGFDPAMMDPIVNQDDAPRRMTQLDAALSATRRWESRHGMTPESPNADFAELLVPGLGLAPVTPFRVLITLFVLLIGPGNYWLLKRARRLHLLVLTVPLAAIATTAALFAYAVFSDGFGTNVRAHSYTSINQRTGDAVCWTRLSYYAGFAPGEGLRMSNDIAVYPIIPGWNEGRFDGSFVRTREMSWEGNEATLARGWLRSRTPTQYLTVRSRKTSHMLELLPAGGRLRATNKLGADVDFLVVIDGNGKLFTGSNLANGSRTMLSETARTDAIRRLRQIFMENEPEPPVALEADDSDFAVMQRRDAQRNYRRYGLEYTPERLGSNLVHDALAKLAGLSGMPPLQLPPRSYVAITKTGPEVELGLPGAREEASFHVIVGQWE